MAGTANFAKAKLKSFVERIEKLEEEKNTISGDIREVYAEAKAEGFDVKALRVVIRLYRQDSAERKEHEERAAKARHNTSEALHQIGLQLAVMTSNYARDANDAKDRREARHAQNAETESQNPRRRR